VLQKSGYVRETKVGISGQKQRASAGVGNGKRKFREYSGGDAGSEKMKWVGTRASHTKKRRMGLSV